MADDPDIAPTPSATDSAPSIPSISAATTPARWKKIALCGAGLLAAFALFGFFALPAILKSVATTKLTEMLHRETSIRDIRINPFAMTLQILGLTIKERSGTDRFVSFEELFVNLDAMSIIRLGPVVSEVRVTEPFVSITRHEDLTYNFSDLLNEFTRPPASPPPSPSTQPAKPLRFSINNIQLTRGQIDFHDRPKHADHAVRDLTITLPFLSNLPASVKIFTTPEVRATINGTPVGLNGQTKPFDESLATEMHLDIDKFEIPKYLEYVPGKLTFKLPSASLDTHLTVAFTQFKDKTPSLTVAGTAALNGLVITTLDDRPIFTLPLFNIDVDTVDVFGKSAHVKSVLIQHPELRVSREPDGTIDVMKLGLEPPAAAPVPAAPHEELKPESRPGQEAETPFRIRADEIKLDAARVAFTDKTTRPHFTTTVHPLTLTVRHFSNETGRAAVVDLSLVTDGGESLSHHGELTVEPLSAHGTVSIQDIPIKRYAPYYDQPLRFTVEDGRLTLSTHYAFAKPVPEARLTGAAASLSALRLRRKGEKSDFFTLPELAITQAEIDVDKRTVTVGEARARQAQLLVERGKDGTLNLSQLTIPSAASTEKPASPPASRAPEQASPWTLQLKTFALERSAVKVLDRMPADPVTLALAPIDLIVANVSTAKNHKAGVSLKAGVNKTGSLTAGGSITLDPLSASVKVDAKGLDLVPLQPYFAEKVTLVVTSGVASAQGTVTLSRREPDDTTIGYDGNVALAKFATIDKATGEDLVRFSNFAVNGIHLITSPFALNATDVILDDLVAHVTVNPDKSLNVSRLTATEPSLEREAAQVTQGQSTAPAEAPAEPKAIRIDRVSITNGAVRFTDRSVNPNFSAMLGELRATVSNLSSEPGKPADLDVHATLDGAAPLSISGKLNPLGKDLFADVKIDFREMQLSPLTPYSGKFAGYTIQKGKLSLDLAYRIDQRKLDSTNQVFIDQFTFGDKVDSPDATSLPVKLAVSLLQDRKGQIKLDLPVSGSLDDPKFSVWGVVLDIIVNLLTKAATAPFALLGSLLPGGGEDLNVVEFDYGAAALDAAASKRLASLGTVLADRPALNVEVVGKVDPEKDREGLRKALFDRKLKAQKVKDLVKRGESAASADDVAIDPEEYPTYLARVYKEEDLPNKPTNFLGMTKSLPQPEMEQLILASIAPTDDDLRQLATQRAQAVREFLIRTGQLDPARIFLLDAGTPAPEKAGEKKQPGKLSRVELAVK